MFDRSLPLGVVATVMIRFQCIDLCLVEIKLPSLSLSLPPALLTIKDAAYHAYHLSSLFSLIDRQTLR